MSLNEQERDEWEARFREELEAEHQSHLQSMELKRARSRDRTLQRRARSREHELSALKAEVREAFYHERGYKLYTDSNDRERWVPPEDYERLINRRRHRSRKTLYRPKLNIRARTILMYVVMLGLAVGLGLLLVRSI